MSQSRPLPSIDRTVLRNGMILHARTSGTFGKAIRWALNRQAKREGLAKAWGNHDALLVKLAGKWWVCDAEPPVAHLTELDVWERRMQAGKAGLRFLWPAGAMRMDGAVAAKWWLREVRNSPYDRTAFPRLLWRAVLGPRWDSQAGKPWAWWCTEGARAGWVFAGFDPWRHGNATPLDTEEAVADGGMEDWTDSVMGRVVTN